jgi:hypothetical protein
MSNLAEAEKDMREAFDNTYEIEAKMFARRRPIDRQNPVIMEQFDVLRRCLDRANKDAHIFEATLDHLDHIRTEIGRLEYQLAQDGIIPTENNKNGRFEG